MAWTRYSHASISAQNPRPLGTCDRCGFVYNRDQLQWQLDWAGPRLQNLGSLVCPGCMDTPQQNGQRTIIIPADPIPIPNPRPDPHMYMGQSSYESAINNSSQAVVPTPAYIDPGYQGYPPTNALTFDSATAANVTLSDSDQMALNTGSTEADQGAKVLASQTDMSLYFEVKLSALNPPGGSNIKVGVDINSDSYTVAGSTSSNGTFIDVYGAIWSQGAATGSGIGFLQEGDIVGVAVQSSLGWFRRTPGGYWNGSVTADPYTSVGGVTVSTAGVQPFVLFGGTGGLGDNAWTINTNAALFTGAMPLGFTAWSS